MDILGAWVAGGLTLFMFSFLYKDNIFFKFGEHLYVGVSMGYVIVRIYYDVMVKSLYEPVVSNNQWWLLIPAFLGILLLMRFIPKWTWISRISFAFIVGVGAGTSIPRIISSYLFRQLYGTFTPFVTQANNSLSFFTIANINSLIILIGVTSVLIYFFYSIEHAGVVYKTARIGIYFLMISFGAAFGYTVMARMSLLIGRIDDLLTFSSKEYGYATTILLIIIAVSLMAFEIGKKENR